MSKEPHEFTASEMSALFAARELSPVEVTEACLTRIEALDAEINAFCHLDPHASQTMAEASEARWLAGEPLSPLDGVPGRGEGSARHQGLADASRLLHRRSTRLCRHRRADRRAAARRPALS